MSAVTIGNTADRIQRGGESHHTALATGVRLLQPLHQLALLERGSAVEAQGLHSIPQATARIDIQDVVPILLVHRHHLTLPALQARHRLPKVPGLAVVITVEAEGVRGGLAPMSEALSVVNVVGVGRNEQTARLELDAVTWAQSKGGPFCKQDKEGVNLRGQIGTAAVESFHMNNNRHIHYLAECLLNNKVNKTVHIFWFLFLFKMSCTVLYKNII